MPTQPHDASHSDMNSMTTLRPIWPRVLHVNTLCPFRPRGLHPSPMMISHSLYIFRL